MKISNLNNILLKSDKLILTYKQFEAVKFGNWYQSFFSVSFFYDNYANMAYLKLGIKNQEKQIASVEFRSIGKPNKEKKYSEFKISFPQDIDLNKDFDYNFFIDDVVELFNRNKFGYTFTINNVVKDKNLASYAIIKGNVPYSFKELEVAFASLKDINYEIKDFWLHNVKMK